MMEIIFSEDRESPLGRKWQSLAEYWGRLSRPWRLPPQLTPSRLETLHAEHISVVSNPGARPQ